MSFPTSPSNNQEAQVNGIIYVWNASKGAWRRKVGSPLTNGQAFDGDIIANSGTRSTSTTTGAIQVTREGGVGVTGNVWAGAFYSDNYFYANGASIIVEAATTSNISNISGNIQGGEAGQLVYQSSANVTSFVTNGDYGKILASNGPGNMPIWVDLQELESMTGSPFITQLVYPEGATSASEAGGETVYVLGRGFQPACSVTVDGDPVLSTTFVSSTNVSIVTSSILPGSYPLKITNPNRRSYTYEYIEFSGAGFPRFLNPEGYLNFVAENYGFNQYIAVVGGYPPYNFQITSGALPIGMTIDAGSGLISGIAPDVDNPTAFNFRVQVTDNNNQVISRNFYILVTVPLILSNELTLSSIGSGYLSARIAQANAAVEDYTVSLSSIGSDYLSARIAQANTAVEDYTVSLSSIGSDYLNARIAQANTAVEDYTLSINTIGSDYLNARIATANASAYSLSMSAEYHNR
jgi:hypothetical protein